jgi:hypothetical protein
VPGPIPKHPDIRQHRIKRTTRATLVDDGMPLAKPVRLPACPNDGKWHPMAKRFWDDVWESPMISEYLLADVHGLLRLTALIDQFWKKPTVSLSGEIRLMGQLFGLSPIDRRRLEWQIVSTEEAKDKRNSNRVKRAIQIDHDDPRMILE